MWNKVFVVSSRAARLTKTRLLRTVFLSRLKADTFFYTLARLIRIPFNTGSKDFPWTEWHVLVESKPLFKDTVVVFQSFFHFFFKFNLSGWTANWKCLYKAKLQTSLNRLRCAIHIWHKRTLLWMRDFWPFDQARGLSYIHTISQEEHELETLIFAHRTYMHCVI